ncbi:zinc finger protein 219-like [Eriocheir sinensis]|uniref:zinc finger protein 219-like n=1 Tax=Eriocheir sinensis TaxID=95602 RepID=UPI0021C9E007|nr:zinc finger protein 219-like [Eriocheir sinensis]
MCGDDLRHDARYDAPPPPEPRPEVRHEPPLDLREVRPPPCTEQQQQQQHQQQQQQQQRLEPRPEVVPVGPGPGERVAASPPLPPSSLPHSCQLCGKLISCRRNLWKHMERVHFNNPAVRCSLCAKMFKNKYALKDHQRIYHGGLSEPPPPPPPHSSLLSRILQDPRHAQGHPPQPHDPRHPPPMDLQQPPLMPREPLLRRPLEPHGQPLGRRHHEDEDVGGAGTYPGMGMGAMISQSLAPSMVGSPSSLAPPRPDWPTQDNPLALVNRAFLSELHQLVTKAD